MSGIYIPGGERPKACIACPFAQYWSEPTTFADDSPFQKVFIVCSRTRSKIQNETSRNDDCPLILVHDHGRLIDADALFDFILNIYKTAQCDARKAYRDVLDTIVAAGDVIPAEEGK